jgi:hypothetical protein
LNGAQFRVLANSGDGAAADMVVGAFSRPSAAAGYSRIDLMRSFDIQRL